MDRDAFLRTISGRLGRTAAAPPLASRARGVPDGYRAAPLGAAGGDLLERFRTELERLGGRVSTAADPSAALRALLEELNPGSLVTWSRSEFAAFGIGWLWDQRRVTEWAGDAAGYREAALAADVGITGASFAVANTGTLVLTTGATRPRLTSLGPRAHVALVRRSQVVARLGEAYAGLRLASAQAPSGVFCITGPSRTADIENDLSIGVHGPAALHVLLAD